MAAEFKISRLKYTWKGQWTTGTVYNRDDVVNVGGKVYTCLERHTASIDFYDDLEFFNNNNPPQLVPRWDLTAEGISFIGVWSPSTLYNIGDIIRFGNYSYICLEGHISAANPEQFNNDLVSNYWSVFFSGIDWKNNWLINTFYRTGDLVRFSGKSYICIQSHTSTSSPNPGLLADLSKWEEFVEGINWTNEWLPAQLYNVNDLVKYGGIVYKCNQQHVSNQAASLGLEQDRLSGMFFI